MSSDPVSDKIEAINVLQKNWMMRDRIIAVCAVDYTDLALGLGETTMLMSVFACSSANIAHAHAKASSMGHTAETMKVEGFCSEEFERLLGIVGRSWNKKKDWGYRSIDIFAIKENQIELGVFMAKGDIKKSKKDLSIAVNDIRRLVSMYGVESSIPTKGMAIIDESMSLVNPIKHPDLWNWLSSCAKLGPSS